MPAVTDAVALAVQAAAASGTRAVVEFIINAPAEATTVETILPRDALSTDSKEKYDITINTPLAAITIDSKALETITGKAASDVKISASEVDATTLNVPEDVKDKVAERPVYDFTITSGGNTISNLQGGKATISVPYMLKAGENPNSIVVYYLNDNGSLQTVIGKYDPTTGTVKLVLSHFSSYVVGYNSIVFTDVSDKAWYKNTVDFVAARGLFSGISTTENLFAPDIPMSRAMFAVVLAKLEGVDPGNFANAAGPFSDVDSKAWYGPAVAWASSEKIINGYNGKFDPDAAITREQLAVMINRYIKYKGLAPETVNTTAFADETSVSGWAKDAVTVVRSYGIMSGIGGNLFDPLAKANRSSAAAVIKNLIDVLVK